MKIYLWDGSTVGSVRDVVNNKTDAALIWAFETVLVRSDRVSGLE